MRYAIEKSSGRRLSKISMSDIDGWLHRVLTHRGCGEKEPLLVGTIRAAIQARDDVAGLGYGQHRDDAVPAFVRGDVEFLPEVNRNGAKGQRTVAESGERHVAV